MKISSNTQESLTTGRVLAKSTLWNIGGNVASLTIALLTVPIILHYLGTARFGVIALVWVVEGQFSLFDLGLSQALTKLVAERLSLSNDAEIPSIFWTSILIMGVMGLAASATLSVSAHWLAYHALKVPITNQHETLIAFHLVAISLPVVISNAALRGFLSAHQRFDLLNSARVPMSLFSYVTPLFVLPFSHTLGPFILVLVCSRFISWIVHFLLCLHIAPYLKSRPVLRGAPLGHMFRFGGWMTVTNVVGPIMVSCDRLVIGATLSMAAVAYYVTPYEAATKLWIIPGAIATVLFPAFATALSSDRPRAALLFQRGVHYIFILLFPVVLLGVAFAHPLMRAWLGSLMAQHSAPIFKLLLLGVLANSIAQVPFWHIQAASRPDITAKVHMVELPCYILALRFLLLHYGIWGAGVAWLVRAMLDAIVMFYLSTRLLPEAKDDILRLSFAFAGGSVALLFAYVATTPALATVTVLVTATIFLPLAWRYMLTARERAVVWRFTKHSPVVAEVRPRITDVV